MEIAHQVHFIPLPSPTYIPVPGPNVYLVIGQVGALIDAGYKDAEQVKVRLDYLKGLGDLRLAYIIITHAHADHLGGVDKIRRETGAKVVAHPKDIAKANKALSIPVDEVVEDGARLRLGGLELEIVHTPGHSPGHICIYLGEGGILFSGDTVLGTGTTAIPPPPSGDMAQYLNSLHRLLTYPMQLMCPGHGPLIRVPHRKLEELIKHRIEREQQILACLGQGKRTVKELLAEIYPELHSRLKTAAQGQILAHLAKLEKEGRVMMVSRGPGEGEYIVR
ncbi:MAG: MBL fold metallo-hydrolase [Chloroflexi bacterium]|nr:MBL fold metallo-hydrolase [Chloroflexota bacterium]